MPDIGLEPKEPTLWSLIRQWWTRVNPPVRGQQ